MKVHPWNGFNFPFWWNLIYKAYIKHELSMDVLVFTWYKIGTLVGCNVKHLQFSSFLRIALTIRLSIFYILWCIDLFTGFCFTPHYYFFGSSTIQCYKLISFPYNLGGIVVSIILLFYLESCFPILRCIRDPICYDLIIWYKGDIKIDW